MFKEIMKNSQVYYWILKNPQNYPGLHNQLHQKLFRSVVDKQTQDHKVDELYEQFSGIIKGFKAFMKKQVSKEIKCINCPDFGLFLFYERNKHISSLDYGQEKTLSSQDTKYQTQVVIKFEPIGRLSRFIVRVPTDLESANKFKRCSNTVFMDYAQIASELLYTKQLVASCLRAINKALGDLAMLNKQVQFDLGITKLFLKNKVLSEQNNTTLLLKAIQSRTQPSLNDNTNSLWHRQYQKMWSNTLLGGLQKQPNARYIKQHFQKAIKLQLKAMCLLQEQEYTCQQPKRKH